MTRITSIKSNIKNFDKVHHYAFDTIKIKPVICAPELVYIHDNYGFEDVTSKEFTPEITATNGVTTVKSNETFEVEVDLGSAPEEELTVDILAVANGTVSEWTFTAYKNVDDNISTPAQNIVATALITPDKDFEGDVTVTVDEGAFTFYKTGNSKSNILTVAVKAEEIEEEENNGEEEEEPGTGGETPDPQVPADAKYAVTYDANGGSAPSLKTKTLAVGDVYGKLPATSRKGYTLKGWYTAKSGGNKVTADTKVTKASAHTLYAQWTANKYKAKFNVNGGKALKTKSKSVTYSKKYGKLPVAKKAGYKFSGWYTKKSGGKKIIASTKVAITKNTVYYAHWQKIKKYATAKKGYSSISLRSAPSLNDSTIIGSLKAGKKIEIKGSANAYWYKVKYKGQTAYVSKKYVDVK
jgi:uncharacterized repeat protein (TIGR02543 family)